jgi:hypothetical protein
MSLEALLPHDFMRVFTETMELRALAEELVDDPRSKADPDWLLPHLAPGPFLFKHRSLYRAHVQELIARAGTTTKLDLGTKAEVVLGLVEASLVAPLTQGGALLYERLFEAIVGERYAVRKTEGYRGQYDDLLREARGKVRSGRPAVRIPRRHREPRRARSLEGL